MCGINQRGFWTIPKKGNAKECSNYHTIALISHASKVILKILMPLTLRLPGISTTDRGHRHSALHAVGLVSLVSLTLRLRESAPRTEARRPPSLSLHTVGLIPLAPLTLRLPGISTTDRDHRHSALHTVGLVPLVRKVLCHQASAPHGENQAPFAPMWGV